jgi:Hypothetical protein (DUF2513)
MFRPDRRSFSNSISHLLTSRVRRSTRSLTRCGCSRTPGFLDLTRTQPALGVCVRGRTWRGHDFIDSVRDPEIWRKTKEGAQAAGGFTIELLRELAKGFIKTQIEKHTGVKL